MIGPDCEIHFAKHRGSLLAKIIVISLLCGTVLTQCPADSGIVGSYDLGSLLIVYCTFNSDKFLQDTSGHIGNLIPSSPAPYWGAGSNWSNQSVAVLPGNAFFSFPTFTVPSSYSIAVWYYVSYNWQDYERVFEMAAVNHINYVSIMRDISSATDLRLEFNNYLGVNQLQVFKFPGFYTLNTWRHFCLVMNGMTATVYINGIFQTTISLGTATSNSLYWDQAHLGQTAWGNHIYQGQIDEFRIYDRSLSAAEVTSVYNYRGAGTSTAMLLTCAEPTPSCASFGKKKYCRSNGTAICCAGGFNVTSGACYNCIQCTAGTYQNYSGTNSSNCSLCGRGSYQTGTGMSTCSSCGVGTYGTGVGMNLNGCLLCEVGSYAGSTGGSACSKCSTGSYSQYPGSTACLPCSNKPIASTYTGSGAYGNNCTWTCNNGYSLVGSSCVTATSSDPYSVGSSGMQLIQSYYNITCLSHGCWVIDIAYFKSSPDATVALYLPRVKTDTNGEYSKDFNTSFYPSSFPCSTATLSASAATVCCLQDFVGNYHTISSFSAPASCNLSSPPAFADVDAVLGQFSGMPISTVVPLQPSAGQSPSLVTVRLLLDHNEVKAVASSFSGTSYDETLNLFVGLAQFIPTNTRILDSSTEQIRITLQKSDYFTVTAQGSNSYTFLSYINLVASEVMDATDPTAKSQYVAVTFALNSNFFPNTNTGLIPSTSVRIGYGATSSVAAWTQPCESPVSAKYAARLAQTCASGINTCAANYDAGSAFGTVNIPLLGAGAGPLFNLSDPSSLGNIYVELVVSAVDGSNTPVSTQLSAQMPLRQGGVDTWCYAEAAKTSLETVVDSVDIIVGAAGTSTGVASLKSLVGIQRNGTGTAHAALQDISAVSIESGLITLVVAGQKDYFELSGNLGYSLDVEDVISLHIMGDSLYNDVNAIISNPAGSAFQVIVDQVNGRASLQPSTALSALCAPGNAHPLPAASCVLRYDVHSAAPATASGTGYEIVPGQGAAAGAFMQGILGASDFAAALGANFSSLIAAQYGLSTSRKYRRAFWINPGYTWTGVGAAGAGRFTLSQRVVVAALILLNEGGGASGARRSRRVLLQSAHPAGGVGTATGDATMRYGTSPAALMAAAAGVGAGLSSTWGLSAAVTVAQACGPAAALDAELRASILAYLTAAAVPVRDVGIVSSKVDFNSVTCTNAAGTGGGSGQRRQSKAMGATVAVEAVVVLSAPAVLSVSTFSRMPSILSVDPIDVPAGILGDAAAAAADNARDTDTTSKDPGHSPSALVAGAVGGGAAALAAAAAMTLLLRRRRAGRGWGKNQKLPPALSPYFVDVPAAGVLPAAGAAAAAGDRRAYEEVVVFAGGSVSAALGYSGRDGVAGSFVPAGLVVR